MAALKVKCKHFNLDNRQVVQVVEGKHYVYILYIFPS